MFIDEDTGAGPDGHGFVETDTVNPGCSMVVCEDSKRGIPESDGNDCCCCFSVVRDVAGSATIDCEVRPGAIIGWEGTFLAGCCGGEVDRFLLLPSDFDVRKVVVLSYLALCTRNIVKTDC